jgi:hypothetical protein
MREQLRHFSGDTISIINKSGSWGNLMVHMGNCVSCSIAQFGLLADGLIRAAKWVVTFIFICNTTGASMHVVPTKSWGIQSRHNLWLRANQ